MTNIKKFQDAFGSETLSDLFVALNDNPNHVAMCLATANIVLWFTDRNQTWAATGIDLVVLFDHETKEAFGVVVGDGHFATN